MKSLLLICSFFLLIACSDKPEVPQSRPDNVPASAVWVGGPDGGVYVDLAPMKEERHYYASIYADKTGVIWYRGRLQSEKSLVNFNPRNSSAYSFWDGESLVLANGVKLTAKDPIK